MALLLALLLGAVMAPAAMATDLALPEISAAPGETVTVALSVADLPPGGLPLDNGLLTLDLEIAFDTGIVAISDVRDGALAAGAQVYTINDSRPDAPASLSPLRISLIALYPGSVEQSGSLLEFDVQVSAGAGPGQRSDLALTLQDILPSQAVTLLSGGVTVIEAETEQVPLLPPPALLLLAALLGRGARRLRLRAGTPS